MPAKTTAATPQQKKKHGFLFEIKKNWVLYLMTVPGILFFLVFSYIPMGGLVMAFLNNGLSLMGVGQDWVSVIKGLVLLAAVAVDLLSRQQGGPTIPWLRRPKKRLEQAELGSPERPDTVDALTT